MLNETGTLKLLSQAELDTFALNAGKLKLGGLMITSIQEQRVQLFSQMVPSHLNDSLVMVIQAYEPYLW
jgi:hypothetical protein